MDLFFTVMDLDRGIAEFPHSFKECRTDMKVVRHYAPLKILIQHYCYLQVKAVMFQGPPFLKVGGSLGPHFIILDPSLVNLIGGVWRQVNDKIANTHAKAVRPHSGCIPAICFL